MAVRIVAIKPDPVFGAGDAVTLRKRIRTGPNHLTRIFGTVTAIERDRVTVDWGLGFSSRIVTKQLPEDLRLVGQRDRPRKRQGAADE